MNASITERREMQVTIKNEIQQKAYEHEFVTLMLSGSSTSKSDNEPFNIQAHYGEIVITMKVSTSTTIASLREKVLDKLKDDHSASFKFKTGDKKSGILTFVEHVLNENPSATINGNKLRAKGIIMNEGDIVIYNIS